MNSLKPQYITNEEGEKISVVLTIAEYQKLLEKLEELEDIHLYDKAKSVQEPSIPFDKAIKDIVKGRRKKHGLENNP